MRYDDFKFDAWIFFPSIHTCYWELGLDIVRFVLLVEQAFEPCIICRILEKMHCCAVVASSGKTVETTAFHRLLLLHWLGFELSPNGSVLSWALATNSSSVRYLHANFNWFSTVSACNHKVVCSSLHACILIISNWIFIQARLWPEDPLFDSTLCIFSFYFH